MKSKAIWSLMVVLAMVIASCGDDDDNDNGQGSSDSSSSLAGWYTCSPTPTDADFSEMNRQIANHTLLYKESHYVSGSGTQYTLVYAERSLVLGANHQLQISYSRYREWYVDDWDKYNVYMQMDAIHIIDDNTLVKYYAAPYEDGYGEGDGVYTFNAGTQLGRITYYGEATYYTYLKQDNKIIVSNGDIYTITNRGLIKDGSSNLWKKYDPTANAYKTYDNSNSGSGTAEPDYSKPLDFVSYNIPTDYTVSNTTMYNKKFEHSIGVHYELEKGFQIAGIWKMGVAVKIPDGATTSLPSSSLYNVEGTPMWWGFIIFNEGISSDDADVIIERFANDAYPTHFTIYSNSKSITIQHRLIVYETLTKKHHWTELKTLSLSPVGDQDQTY